jgi:SAM-dependent methyltransferase
MRRPRRRRLSVADLVESLHLAHAVWTLHDLDVLSSLEYPATAESLAARHRLDADMLRGVLEYVAARTSLVRKCDPGFQATANYGSESYFLLDLYAGAYGPNSGQLDRLLANPSLASGLVDRARHARAFRRLGSAPYAWPASFVRQMGWHRIVDIGCGPATLLVQLAQQNPEFEGWGIDQNPAMCKAAHSALREAQVGARIKIIEADALRLRRGTFAKISPRVQAVTACHVANEMFWRGSSAIVGWLAGLRRIFPGRPLLVVDYYGRLGSKTGDRATLLHDYAQLISGQGIPPQRRAEWQEIYAAAGCRLVHVTEDTTTTRFAHVVVLSRESERHRSGKKRAKQGSTLMRTSRKRE